MKTSLRDLKYRIILLMPLHKCAGNVNGLTCRWCHFSATWVSCGRSCNWPHLGRHSGAFSWPPRFWNQSLQFLAARRTSASSSACLWAPWGYICLVGIHKTYSDSARREHSENMTSVCRLFFGKFIPINGWSDIYCRLFAHSQLFDPL